MIRTLTNVLKQDKEKFAVPRKVQDIIPVRAIWSDGIFLTGKNKFSKGNRSSLIWMIDIGLCALAKYNFFGYYVIVVQISRKDSTYELFKKKS